MEALSLWSSLYRETPGPFTGPRDPTKEDPPSPSEEYPPLQITASGVDVMTGDRSSQPSIPLGYGPGMGRYATLGAPSGFAPSGYSTAGYAPSGYSTAGYPAPSGFAPSGWAYAPSGYAPPGYAPPGWGRIPGLRYPGGAYPFGPRPFVTSLPVGPRPDGYSPRGGSVAYVGQLVSLPGGPEGVFALYLDSQGYYWTRDRNDRPLILLSQGYPNRELEEGDTVSIPGYPGTWRVTGTQRYALFGMP